MRFSILLIAAMMLNLASAAAFEPPPLTPELRTKLEAMTPMTETPVPATAGKVVVVTFFASWCPPCRPEAAHLNHLTETFAGADLAIISINLFEDFFTDGKGPRMKRFLRQTKPRYAVVEGPNDAEVEAMFGGVTRIPTVLIYDRKGALAFTFVHEKDATKRNATYDEMAKAIKPLI